MPKRIFVVGGPRTGKSTLTERLAFEHGIQTILRTDDLISLGWSEASQRAADWITEHSDGDFIMEGTGAIRGLRKWMRQNEGKPLPEGSTVYILTRPYTPLSKGQLAMAKGVLSIATEIYGELVSRGAVFEHGSETNGG